MRRNAKTEPILKINAGSGINIGYLCNPPLNLAEFGTHVAAHNSWNVVIYYE